MMRSYRIMIGSMLIVATSANMNAGKDIDRSERQLRAAISATDLEQVKILSQKKGMITAENKERLVDAAEEKVEFYEDNFSIIKSKRDLATFVAGIGITIGSVCLSGLGLYWSFDGSKSHANENYMETRRRERRNPLAMIAPLVGFYASLIGLGIAIRGYRCTSASYYLKRAEDIQEFIEKVPVFSTETAGV